MTEDLTTKAAPDSQRAAEAFSQSTIPGLIGTSSDRRV